LVVGTLSRLHPAFCAHPAHPAVVTLLSFRTGNKATRHPMVQYTVGTASRCPAHCQLSRLHVVLRTPCCLHTGTICRVSTSWTSCSVTYARCHAAHSAVGTWAHATVCALPAHPTVTRKCCPPLPDAAFTRTSCCVPTITLSTRCHAHILLYAHIPAHPAVVIPLSVCTGNKALQRIPCSHTLCLTARSHQPASSCAACSQ
jgi:hypothetical protein